MAPLISVFHTRRLSLSIYLCAIEVEGSLRANYVGRALQVYEQMCVSGLKPTVELCTHLVQGFFLFLFTMCIHVVF
jgi:pentatricopeptide repeat protein